MTFSFCYQKMLKSKKTLEFRYKWISNIYNSSWFLNEQKKWFSGSNSQIVKNAALIYLWGRGGSSMDHQDTYCPSMASLPLPKCNNCITKNTGQVPDSLSREYIVFMTTRSLENVTFGTYLTLLMNLGKG